MIPPNNRLPKRNKRTKRSVWLPTLLFIYLTAMTAWFAPELIANGEIVRLITVTVVEIAVIIVLRMFLQKQERKNGE